MDSKSTMRIDKNGNKYWTKNDGLLHRLDGPAMEWANGHKEWYKNGWIHRLGGPAIEHVDGRKEWWLKNKLYKTKEDYFNALPEKSKEKCLFSEDFLNG